MSPSISSIKDDAVAAAKENRSEIITFLLGGVLFPVIARGVKFVVDEIKGE